MGRAGQGDVGDGGGETHSSLRETVKGGCQGPSVAVAAQMVGAEGVDGHEQDVGSRLRRPDCPVEAPCSPDQQSEEPGRVAAVEGLWLARRHGLRRKVT